MNRKSKTANDIDNIESDWQAYTDFQVRWEIGNITQESVVYRKVESSSLKICRRYNRPSGEVMHVTHRCLEALANSQFTRGCSLDQYIGSIIQNEIVSGWNLERDIHAELAEMEAEERELRILEEVARRICAEPCMRRHLASRRELQETIIENVLFRDSFRTRALKTPGPISTAKNPVNRRFFDRIKRFFGKGR